ncbi:MAG: CHAT domain-containing protein [Coleofasciculus sp. C2-GNP5-27]
MGTEAFDNYLNRSGPHVTITPQESDQLELLIISAEEPPIRRRIAGVTRGQVLEVAQEFRRNVTNVRIPRDYITPGQQLYQWLVAPLEDNLQTQDIDNLAFIMDEGLRSLPVAALHDGEGFLIERYSVGLMPSLSLTDTRYVDIRNVGVLAMGADTFQDLNPLPAVPLELSAIAGPLWQGKAFLNQEFTLEKIKEIRSSQPFGIVHLATHGEFKSGQPSNSYIQLWNQKLRLDQLRQLGLNNPPAELLILSACRTALGDREAELGFAGLAIQAGVKSALGSLWYVSDTGTLGFMTSFYDHLQQAPIKAEALRQTQLAMLNGEVRLEDKQLIAGDIQIPLNPELAQTPDQDFTHPYYWSALTLVGNPW